MLIHLLCQQGINYSALYSGKKKKRKYSYIFLGSISLFASVFPLTLLSFIFKLKKCVHNVSSGLGIFLERNEG